ncbi:hypothetical protein [Senegalia massiliensis]|uniref:hypothetical protein n=1 Tax=Senegalia massiliensis TaxID=1720316 RepID=UPI00102FF666|nr:hypothetical protein [Senegalia massiliensis]
MKREKEDFETYKDITEEELDNLWSMMNSYTVELPSEKEIDKSINKLRKYVPDKKKEYHFIDRFYYLIRKGMLEISFINKFFWVISSLLFVIGVIWMYFNRNMNPYLITITLSPLPFTFGIVEIFKGRDRGMMEIEMSCKISYGEILLSKLTIIGFYNIILNTIFTLLLYSISNFNFLRLTIMWFTPFTFISGISLWLAMKIKSSYTMTIIVSLWISLVIMIINTPLLLERLLLVNISAYVGISILGISISLIQIKIFIDKNIINKERGLFEINY